MKGRQGSVDAATCGWVLASFREHAADPGLRTAAGLARAPYETAVHRSQLGRWEAGTTPPTYAVFRRYEAVLGLPRGQLTSVVDVIGRGMTPRRTSPVLARPERDDWAEMLTDLLDKALSSDRMSGVDWDDLTAELARRPEVLLRRRDWRALIARVTTESEVTSGLECTFRLEASARLAGHARSGPLLVELARAALADPASHQFYAVDLLKYSSDPAGAQLLVDTVSGPIDPAAQELGLWMSLNALETLARLDGLTAQQRGRAGLAALRLLRDDGLSIRLHRGAASFIDAIDPPSRQQMVTALRHEQRARLASVLERGSMLTAEEVEATATRVEQRAAQQLGAWRGWPAPLRRLFVLATSAANTEERGMALDALKLLPQGAAIGSAYAAELRERMAHEQLVVADDILARLSWLVQPGDVPYLLELMLDPAADAVTSRQAANAVGNAVLGGPGDSGERAAGLTALTGLTGADVVMRVEESARALLSGDPAAVAEHEVTSVARGHCYVLGMYGCVESMAGLEQLATRRGSIPWARAARWWLDLPPEVRPLAPPT